jgi:hypothetical protein
VDASFQCHVTLERCHIKHNRFGVMMHDDADVRLTRCLLLQNLKVLALPSRACFHLCDTCFGVRPQGVGIEAFGVKRFGLTCRRTPAPASLPP